MECDPIRRQPLGTDYASPIDYIFKDPKLEYIKKDKTETANNKNDRKEESGGLCYICGEARMIRKTYDSYKCPNCGCIIDDSR